MAEAVLDGDGDGFLADEDCNDTDASINGGAVEVCDGLDNDCDGEIDEEVREVFYADADGDGFGDPDVFEEACDSPSGSVTNPNDCDDTDPDVYPGAAEVCDGIDNDCSGEIDEGVGGVWYADIDGDGYGDADVQTSECDPGDGWVQDDTDCDDNEAEAFPGNPEVCDEIDNNCDGTVDEGQLETYYQDLDGDGWGDPSVTTEGCVVPAGYAEAPGDCDEEDALVFPGATEECDLIDNDCDGTVDEGDAVDALTWYADTDTDGYGDASSTTTACSVPSGYVADNTDCDDGATTVNPGAAEECDSIDNDCDGTVDESDAVDALTWYADTDTDGYGDASISTTACAVPSGYVADNTDCDDGATAVNPGAAEECDSIDNDCDGTVDEGDAVDALTWYADTDTDGYGDASSSTTACSVPGGYVADDTDCDDGATAVFPGATEVCDGIDNNCDGTVDEASAVGSFTFYADRDSDGYGDASSTTTACAAPTGYVSDNSDCDDSLGSVNPGEDEICNGIDDDCDSVIDDLGPTALYAGSLTAGTSKTYQYSPVTSGAGYLYANWTDDPRADSYELAVGSTPGDDDVESWTDVGAVSSATLSGLTLDGAWDGAEYYVSIRPTNGSTACSTSATADVVQIAEAATWTGDVADLRAPDAYGGYTTDWPEAGVDAVYGEHWFEDVYIDSSTTVYVQGWGAEDSVSAGISSSNIAVTDPVDGWVSLYANDIEIAGTITATGRGYGGGGGGGAGVRGGYQGYGGSVGLGGDGGPASTSYAGAGGGGSPGGAGGVGATRGGAGNMYGGGGGSTGCSGSNGRDGGDGSTGTYGATGGTASSGSPGVAGQGEFEAGGGQGVSGCDNWSGGGGGAYGAGGGGGSQWAGSTAEASGGGAGGAGGSGGGRTVNGASAAGPYGGAGGTYSSGGVGVAGTAGGYLSGASNGDSSTDRSWALGSGGGGGSGGYQETGGGGGGAGGGAILLYAVDSLFVDSSARLLANGAGGGGGARDNGGSSTSAVGGVGAGGTLILEAQDLEVNISWPYISACGGGASTSNGGTIKLFYDSFAGTTPSGSAAGRVYDAGSGSWAAP